MIGNLYSRATLGKSNTKTFCCNSKKSDQTVLGSKNKGTNCMPSSTGQCNAGYGLGQNYKFRCFNVKDDKSFRPEIKEGPQLGNSSESCSYVTGTLGKIGTGIGLTGKVTGKVLTGVGSVVNLGNNLDASYKYRHFGGRTTRRRHKSSKRHGKSKSLKNRRKSGKC